MGGPGRIAPSGVAGLGSLHIWSFFVFPDNWYFSSHILFLVSMAPNDI